MENLYNHLGFWDSIMCTVRPNNHFWSMAVTGMDANGYNMMNDDIFSLFWHYGGYCGSTWEQHEEIGLRETPNVWREKNTVYACLLISEEGDSFRRLLDLALAPNRTTEGCQKQ